MPGQVQGNKNRNSSAALWQAGHAYSLGALITPSPANGLVVVASAAGTSGGSQPAWTAAPFPTVGTTFTDGGVTWTVIGTQPGHWAPIIQEPVDSDPPIAYQSVQPDISLADQLAWITLSAGILGLANTWTMANTFQGTTIGSLVTITQQGSGVALTINGGASADNPTLIITAGNGQNAAQFDGDSSGGYALIGQAHGANFAGIRGIGDGSGAGVEGASVGGPGGLFTGGASGGAGVIGEGGANSPGGSFLGDAAGTADGVTGTGGLNGPGVHGIGGSNSGNGVFGLGTGGFAGVHGQGDSVGLGPGGQFVASSRRGNIELTPHTGFPSTPSEGDCTYNLSTHKAYTWDGTSWQPWW